MRMTSRAVARRLPSPRPPPPGANASVRVAEVTSERDGETRLELPLHLLGQPGAVALQLRTTLPRVGIGSGVARRSTVLTALEAEPDLPGLVRSRVGGTFSVGGPGWLGLAAVGVPPHSARSRLDWMMAALGAWCLEALRPLGIFPRVGRVESAWCAGFSDVAVQGRKLIGLGFRVTRTFVAVHGIMAVRPISDADFALLVRCHRLIDAELRREAVTSLVECTGDPRWETAIAIDYLQGVTAPAG